MAQNTVLVLVGSLRKESVNRQLAELAAEVAPDGVAIARFDRLGELPFYNEDIDNESAPEPVVALREAAAGAVAGDRKARGIQAELGGMRSRASAALSTISGALPRTIEALLEYLPSEESLQAGLPKDLEKGLARAS